MLLLVVPISFYVGYRGWQWFRLVAPFRYAGILYWLLFTLVAGSFALSRGGSRWLPPAAAQWAGVVGAYWLAFLIYALMVVVVLDLGRLLNRWLRLIPDPLSPTVAKLAGGAVLLFLVGTLVYGVWNARTPVVTAYEVTIPKSGGPYRELNVVMASDLHLGIINGESRIDRLAQMVNGLHPDVILLAGDILDGDLQPFVEQHMGSALGKLQAPLGTYAVLGNHDARGAQLPVFRQELERAGIQLLTDEAVEVGNGFYLAGRKDPGWGADDTRKPLSELLRSVDRSRPILLMDHQPKRLDEAEAAGVDLQVSGHTHRGQIWPGSLITSRIYEVDWGQLQKGGTNVVVSLGFGTWGPPIRIGNRPEVVSIRVRFAPAAAAQ
jgi:predicted MPP superfamily phosphohydrolase